MVFGTKPPKFEVILRKFQKIVLLQSDNEYQIEGFKTVLPIKSNHEDKTRIICLIKNEWMSKCTIRNELMTSDFASIWIEIKTSNLSSSIIGGYYREWTVNGDTTEKSQMTRMQHFSNQIEKAATKNKSIIIALGKKTFLNDATNVWNAAPNNLKHSCTISAAKKAIKLYVSMLPM